MFSHHHLCGYAYIQFVWSLSLYAHNYILYICVAPSFAPHQTAPSLSLYPLHPLSIFKHACIHFLSFLSCMHSSFLSHACIQFVSSLSLSLYMYILYVYVFHRVSPRIFCPQWGQNCTHVNGKHHSETFSGPRGHHSETSIINDGCFPSFKTSFWMMFSIYMSADWIILTRV